MIQIYVLNTRDMLHNLIILVLRRCYESKPEPHQIRAGATFTPHTPRFLPCLWSTWDRFQDLLGSLDSNKPTLARRRINVSDVDPASGQRWLIEPAVDFARGKRWFYKSIWKLAARVGGWWTLPDHSIRIGIALLFIALIYPWSRRDSARLWCTSPARATLSPTSARHGAKVANSLLNHHPEIPHYPEKWEAVVLTALSPDCVCATIKIVFASRLTESTNSVATFHVLGIAFLPPSVCACLLRVYTAPQSQKAATAYFSSKKLLSFGFARQFTDR